MHLQEATEVLVRKRELDINKGVHVYFTLVAGMLQALETELSHLGQSSNPVD